MKRNFFGEGEKASLVCGYKVLSKKWEIILVQGNASSRFSSKVLIPWATGGCLGLQYQAWIHSEQKLGPIRQLLVMPKIKVPLLEIICKLVIVFFRFNNFVGLLIFYFVSLHAMRVSLQGGGLSVPAQFLQVLCPKRVMSLATEFYLQILGSTQKQW